MCVSHPLAICVIHESPSQVGKIVQNRSSTSSEQNIVDLYVGRRLKHLRTHRRISQKQLAGRLGITFQQVQKYEKGLNRLPASRMLSICLALDITPNDLFKDLLGKQFPLKEPLEFTDDETALVEIVRQLNPQLKSQVKKIVETIAETKVA